MLNQLNKDQQDILATVRQEWLDRAFKEKEFDRHQFDKGIAWLYQLIGLPMPMVIVVDSPLGAQYAVGMLKKVLNGHAPTAQVRAQVRDQVRDQVGDQVWDQVGAQVRAQVGDQVRAQVRAQVRDQVRAQVRDQVGDQVWAQVWDQVGDQVWDQVGDQVWAQVWAQVRAQEFEPFTSYGSFSDYGWVAFYDLFRRIGITLGPATDKFAAFADLLMAGHYDFITMSGVVVVCKKPISIVMDQGRMHNTQGPCIEWADGYKLYAVRGRILPSWIWEEKVTKKRYLSEKNAEYRAGIYAVMGQEKMMDMLEPTIIDTCMDNDETLVLLKTKEIFDTADGKQPYAWVKCNCPSTGTTYLLGVKPHHIKAKAAMAELWGVTEEEYTIEQHT